MNEQFIIAPLVGLGIGWLTNYLAIKMLFKPQKAYYIGRFHIPLTPGLIPKEQPRLAKAIGDTVARELLSAETLQTTLSSPTMQEKVGSLADNIFNKYRSSEYTMREELISLFGKEDVDDFIAGTYDKLTELIYQKLNDINFDEETVGAAVEQSITVAPSKNPLKRLKNSSVSSSITKPIAGKIYKKLAADSLGTIRNIIHKEGDKLLDQKACELISRYEDKLPLCRQFLIDNYNRTIDKELPKVLEAINLAKIIEDRINAYDVCELEQLIQELAKKELNAIVAIGAVLGFLMGYINVFLNMLF